MKIKFFKKENNFKKKDFELNPNLYWSFSLIFLLIIIILSFILGYFLLKKVDKDLAPSNESAVTQTPLIDHSRIDTVLFFFSEREKRSNQILQTPTPILDPSL